MNLYHNVHYIQNRESRGLQRKFKESLILVGAMEADTFFRIVCI